MRIIRWGWFSCFWSTFVKCHVKTLWGEGGERWWWWRRWRGRGRRWKAKRKKVAGKKEGLVLSVDGEALGIGSHSHGIPCVNGNVDIISTTQVSNPTWKDTTVHQEKHVVKTHHWSLGRSPSRIYRIPFYFFFMLQNVALNKRQNRESHLSRKKKTVAIYIYYIYIIRSHQHHLNEHG